MNYRYSLLFAVALLFPGCVSNTTYTSVPHGTAVITLVNVEERAIRMGANTTLPAGDYLPAFASDDGVFYQAPTSITIRSLGVPFPSRGGLFIPHARHPKMKQAAWIQLKMGSVIGGVLGNLGSGTPDIEIYPFDEPVKYTAKKETQKNSP